MADGRQLGMRLSEDLTDRRWIVLKGWLFVVCGLLAAALILIQSPSFLTALLLAVCTWAFSRWTYFLYNVMPTYVNSEFRYQGMRSLFRGTFRRSK